MDVSGISTKGLVFDYISGHFPVQAEGSIDRNPFCFRARGSRWSISVGRKSNGAPLWEYEEPYGAEPYAAGAMDTLEARELVLMAAEKFREYMMAHKSA